MKTMELKKDFYWAGIVDKDLRVFDIIMHTEFGTTYNSYVLRTGGKTILFETVKEAFFDEYLDKLREDIDVTKIDYLVVSHTEPDHAGSVGKLLDLNPQLKIIATGCALGFLRQILNRDFFGIAVKDNQEMKIGDKTLHFLAVPNLHWPDTMYTYIEEDHILVTCDSFGSHYAFEDVLVSKVTNKKEYLQAVRYYYDCILGPFRAYMLKALERIGTFELSMICPGHGPVLDQDVGEMLETYKAWSTVENPNRQKTVVIPYVSAYGYTGRLAEKISEGIKDSGPVDVHVYDMVSASREQVLKEMEYADGILFGTPTILGDALEPIWDLTTSIHAVTHSGKLASAFGSYGWSGEGVPHIVERLKQLRLKVMDSFRVRFKPSETELIDAYEYGYNFGCVLQDKENPKKAKGTAKLVKCLVCGDIFDASLDICPVCGVGRENFVPVENEESGFQKDSDNFYVILGNGAAGLNAAREIRSRDKTGSIVMVSEEPYPAYNRPMLTKAMMAEIRADQIAIEDASWYEENRIYQVLGKRIQAIDTEAKEVVLEDQSRLKYSKLIYALGAECFIPPIAGHEKEEVIAIRRLSDIEKIAAMLKRVKQVVVIGGGVLGLEAAWELKKAGCQATVLELAPQIMGRQLDTGAGEMLQQISENVGIQIETGVTIQEITGDSHVTGVRLADGREFPAELVILSCGVRANTALAEKAGIHTERSVVVDQHMRTNVEDIYAAGDCAQYEGQNYGIWPQAVAEGKVAGACAAGESGVKYEAEIPALTFHGMNTALFSIGDNGKKPDRIYKTLEFRDDAKKQYQKYYFLNNRLSGVILLGDTSKMAEMTKAVTEKKTFRELFSEL